MNTPRRADDQHAAALVAAAVGVEQVRRAVQRDHRLAGARAAARSTTTPLPGARIALSCSAWMVATIECIDRSRARDSCAISAPSPTIGRSVSASASSRSSSTPTTVGAGAAQHPAAYDALRLGRGGLVEHRGRGRAPVDQQRVAVARRAARSGRCSAARGRARRAGRAGRRPGPRARRRAGRSACAAWNTIASRSTRPPSWPSRPRLVALPGQLPGRPRPTSPAGRRRGRRTPARARSRAPRCPRSSPPDSFEIAFEMVAVSDETTSPQAYPPAVTVGADFRRCAARGLPAVRRSRSSRCRATSRPWCGSSSSRCRRPGSASARRTCLAWKYREFARFRPRW